jgi:hypothetical protein
MVGGTLPSFIFAEAAAVTVSSILERFSRSGLLKSMHEQAYFLFVVPQDH